MIVTFAEGGQIEGDEDLHTTDAEIGAFAWDLACGQSTGQQGRQQIETQGQTAAFPMADGQGAAGASHGAGICRQIPILIVASRHRERAARTSKDVGSSPRKLAQRHVEQDGLALLAGDGNAQRIVADSLLG